jgi:hypothetical protein
MREKRGVSRLGLLAGALLIVALFPAAARAENRTFVNAFNLFPHLGALTEGPANVYPSSVAVSGVAGTVTDARVTLIGLTSSSPDDIDAVIVGPNGQQVMLMSDACGVNPTTLEDDNFTFDDSASTFLSDNGPCGSFSDESHKPSNYENPDDDDLTPEGGPAGPYLNSLSLLAGGSPNGAWNLFVFDDNSSFHGFDLSAWALNLEVQPPPAAPAAPASAATGQRAAALAKCKSKKTKKARRKCRQKAQSLPL